MATRELHRGRLIDHLQLVVKDLAASKRFYTAVFGAIGIPLAGEGDDHFWADELFISTRGYFAAFVDPDGNNIEVVFHGPAKKSAESVKITFGS
jgi:catechol 2,3-dioxygenase-like lactoylglutathione lyase family enzyme